jgi:hypothetical protein
MYADTGTAIPCFQNFPLDVQHFDDFYRSYKFNACSGKLLQPSTITEYDLGGEGDLFKAPEPIILEEPPMVGLDPMEAAISMISCGDAAILPQELKVADISSLQSEQLYNEVFYECQKDLMEKAAIGTSIARVLDIKIPPIDENSPQVDEFPFSSSFPKSTSSECLRSMEWPPVKTNFLDFTGVDFEAYGMRRAYSEGDIKTLGTHNGSINPIHSPVEHRTFISNCSSEERKEKLSRYKNKKTKRNFGRKIKYACRKALADSQPRVRGRFAKTEEMVARSYE